MVSTPFHDLNPSTCRAVLFGPVGRVLQRERPTGPPPGWGVAPNRVLLRQGADPLRCNLRGDDPAQLLLMPRLSEARPEHREGAAAARGRGLLRFYDFKCS